jgi:phage tail sheath gpL-like
LVYDMGRGNLLGEQYQNYIVSNADTDTRQFPLGDGSTTVFTADAIDLGTAEDSTNLELAVEVYVGGILQTTGYTITGDDPVVVTFATAPASGSAVAILVRRGIDWYNPGVGTPSDGVPLQDTDNPIARFLRGGI